MSFVQLACEQAIFTSIRTPTGEGYRIVAASAGLKTDEKQAITRNSPSHESLCAPPEDAGEQTMGVAFYALPTGRLCVAFSCLAGAEHTGRGGFRVYTVTVVFEREAFAGCGFNPFNIVRAMACAGLTQPMLKPAIVLPPLDLEVPLEPAPGAEPCFPGEFAKPYRGRVLELALAGGEALVDLPQGWMRAAEGIILGLPGELRESVSLSAGLRFSTGRRHRLQLLHDDKNAVRTRGGSRRAEYIDVRGDEPPAARDSAWLEFVERHWQAGDFRALRRRTSRTFSSTKLVDLEDAGALYNLIDSVEKLPTARSLELAAARIRGRASSANPDIVDEFLSSAQGAVLRRLSRGEPADWTLNWRPLLGIWRQSPGGTAFAQPILRTLVQTWAGRDALAAAEAGLDLTRDVPPSANTGELESLIETVLRSFASAAGRVPEGQRDRADALLVKWQRVRPNSTALAVGAGLSC